MLTTIYTRCSSGQTNTGSVRQKVYLQSEFETTKWNGSGREWLLGYNGRFTQKVAVNPNPDLIESVD